MKELTQEQARLLLALPIINKAEIARQMYPNDPNYSQKFNRRINGVKKLSNKTLESLSVIFCRLHFVLSDSGEQVI